MHTKPLGPLHVSALGLGCMSLSHAYGQPPESERAIRLLQQALDLGYTLFDTAALYGFGANETLLGQALSARRSEFVLASKCGVYKDADGQRSIDGHPKVLRRTCEDSLRRLRTDVIDLYYLHRWDRRIPIEESIGALADLVSEGKIRAIGLSEVSAATLRRAHAVHPIVALQTEYSLWTRNVEIAALKTCRELNVALVAFSPIARGFLAGAISDPKSLTPKDIRRNMPRFQQPHFERNLCLLEGLAEQARQAGCSMAQLALAWLLAQGEDIIPIPGTTRFDHLSENAGAAQVTISPQQVRALDTLINADTVSGARYAPATQAEIDTEQ